MDSLSGDIGIASAVCLLVAREVFAYLRQKRVGTAGELPKILIEIKEAKESIDNLKKESENSTIRGFDHFDKIRDHQHDIKNSLSRIETRFQLYMEEMRKRG